MREIAEPPLVFDYAVATPSIGRRIGRVAVAVAALILGGGLGAGAGWLVAPVSWTESAACEFPPYIGGGKADEIVRELDRDMAGATGALLTPETLQAVAGEVAGKGHNVPGNAESRWLRRGLRVRRIPGSAVITISFTSGDRALSRDVVNALSTRAEARPFVAGNLQILRATVVARRHPAFPVASGAVGAAMAVLAHRLSRRARRNAATG